MVHHKAASCSAIPSFSSLSSISTSSTNTTCSLLPDDERCSNQDYELSTLFPLPSFCLYSQRALLNEYALESDIIQFLYPISTVLQERLPMLVGILQSLFTVVNDMHSKDEPDNQLDSDTEDENDDQQELPFTIVGLNTMKLVVWNSMHKDLSLVIFVSSQLTDSTLLNHMQLLKESLSDNVSPSLTASQIGHHLNTSCSLPETFTHL